MLFVLSSVIFSTISSFTYFRLYAPELVTILSYPEGKYGPPLLREQIVAVFSFAAILGFLGAAFISGLLAENDSNTYVSTLYINVEKVDVEARIRASINKSFSALPIVLTAVFIFYSFLMNVTGQLVLRTATFFISTVIPYTAIFH